MIKGGVKIHKIDRVGEKRWRKKERKKERKSVRDNLSDLEIDSLYSSHFISAINLMSRSHHELFS